MIGCVQYNCFPSERPVMITNSTLYYVSHAFDPYYEKRHERIKKVAYILWSQNYSSDDLINWNEAEAIISDMDYYTCWWRQVVRTH